MPTKNKAKKIRSTNILNISEKLFYKKGFSGVSMDQIAQNAKITKRTLYKYFDSKNDLYLAVSLKGLKKFLKYLQQIPKKNQSGLDKFYEIEKAFYKFSKNSPTTFRVLIHFGKYVKKESKYYGEWIKLRNDLKRIITGSIQTGQKDKSIRKDFEPSIATFNLLVMMSGYFYLLKETGEDFLEQENLKKENLINFSLQLWKNSIKNNL